MLQQGCENYIYRYYNDDPKPEWISNLMLIEPLIPKFNKLVDEL